MSKKVDDRQNVVIVGGGHAGGFLARTLSGTLDASKFHVVLINERPYAIHLLAGARMTVTAKGKFEDLALMPYDTLFVDGNGTVKIDSVTAVEEPERGKGGVVVLKSGERVAYAALVLASGFSWTGPLDFPATDAEVRAHIAQWRRRYAEAGHVVLIGGGAVGIETAGELRDTFPDKKITLVQSDKMLLNAVYPKKFRKDVERRVRARKIDVLLGERVDAIPEPGTVGLTTSSGKVLADADLVVPTFGPRPNNAYISTLGADVLDERGLVQIRPTFELRDHPGVFAVGDIIAWDEQKQAAKAPAHIAVAAPNIASFLAGAPLAKAYKGSKEVILIPVGKNGGAAYMDMLWGIVLGDWFVRWLKGADLFVNKTRAGRGL
ncbi:hypothetical protein B0H21DRAFT_692666 [Amylocystis lapponica]|nr:hypothetical protein B0H21DRAFT_692666 [Amylocystis lapponica]